MGKKILLIDDDRNILELASLALQKEGYTVAVAFDGAQGLELAKALPAPALIILDVNMPRMDGWETLRRLKIIPQTEKIPIVMLTTEGLVKDVDKAMSLGATTYLVKPLDIGRLIKKAVSLIGK